MSRITLVLAAIVATVLPTAVFAQATTTRIETRPFYGATVTIESGVRVFRPLPPTDRVIINPHGQTPLNFSFEDYRSTSHNYTYNYGAPGVDPATVGAPLYGYGPYYTGRHLNTFRGHRAVPARAHRASAPRGVVVRGGAVGYGGHSGGGRK